MRLAAAIAVPVEVVVVVAAVAPGEFFTTSPSCEQSHIMPACVWPSYRFPRAVGVGWILDPTPVKPVDG